MSKFEKGGQLPTAPGHYAFSIKAGDDSVHTTTIEVVEVGGELYGVGGRRVAVERMTQYGRWGDKVEPEAAAEE